MKDMVENFTGFYNAFFEFSARSAYRIVKEYRHGYCTGSISVFPQKSGDA